MAALLTWDPNYRDSVYSFDMDGASTKTLSGEPYKDWWSVGNSTQKVIPLGCRLFLLRQVVEPKGIVGSGWAISEPYKRLVRQKQQQVVDIEYDVVLDPEKFPPLDWRHFQSKPLQKVRWTTQRSGISVPDELDAVWKHHVQVTLGWLPISLFDETTDVDEKFREGRHFYRLHRQIERNSKVVELAKARAKQEGRLHCWVCGFDFYEWYGDIGAEFIEAHHTIPVSELLENSKTDVKDIAMVCSNCHRMLHRRRPWLKIDELTSVFKGSGDRWSRR